jgi:HD superfamily phosphohydrolase
MSDRVREIPEIVALDARRGLIRIPPELDVPLTDRVQAIVDSEAFRRLAHISQLGLVSLVYPGAQHTRFEHSLGVYRLCLLFLQHFAQERRFAERMSVAGAERLIAASLLHDIGHWPFCHVIEDLQLPEIPEHESLARDELTGGPLAQILETHWQIDPNALADLLVGHCQTAENRLAASILSGPIDVDKMDYLMRDSLHAGVPYGRNFDQARLIGSLCVNEAGDALALSDKGRTAAEMMVFARYVMFSEVYWHHTVRAATAMFQRAFYRAYRRLNLSILLRCSEADFIERLRAAATEPSIQRLLDGLFGSQRRLYKRWLEYAFFEQHQLYEQLARQPYPRLVSCSERLAKLLSSELGRPIDPEMILIDAPPVKLEVQFQVEIYHSKLAQYRSLRDVSPVVKTLEETQFDNYVKRVRVFVAPEIAEATRQIVDPERLLRAALE